ncbi:MAG: hypothetical protein OSB07_08345, partial [Dehalococcoidia bacterium]|nr:hypothetical protein [Dehalococcoidia bacterium]
MIRALKALTSREFQQYILFLLIPGLSLKRWLGVGAIGLTMVTLGVIFSLEISTGPTFVSFLESVSLRNESPFLRGGVFISIGAVGALVAVFGLVRSLGNVRRRTRNLPLFDSIYVERVLGSGPKITVIGGGT